MKDELEAKTEEVKEKWESLLDAKKEVKITVAKKDIFVDAFGICWMPYCMNENGKLVKAY